MSFPSLHSFSTKVKMFAHEGDKYPSFRLEVRRADESRKYGETAEENSRKGVCGENVQLLCTIEDACAVQSCANSLLQVSADGFSICSSVVDDKYHIATFVSNFEIL